MSKASELMERVLSRMEERNVQDSNEPEGFDHPVFDAMNIGDKYIRVYETGRHNGTEENVTVTIQCLIKISEYSSRLIQKIRVPKNASDKVIDKRLDEAEKWLNG